MTGSIGVLASHAGIILLPWVIFLLVWGAMTFFSSKKIEVHGALGGNMANLLLLTVPMIFFALPAAFILNAVVIPKSQVSQGIGLAVAMIGVAIAVWARVVLGKNWSSDISFKENQTLITGGPYATVRHPIYTGVILMVLGIAVYFGYIAGFIGLIISFVGASLKLRGEEGLMSDHFPKEYGEYKKRTKAIIPYVY